MSNGKRIKQLRQKTFNNDFLHIPFGADGNFIDMFSGLDLEEELKIGGNHYVQINSDEFNTQVTEYYSTAPITDPLNDNNIIYKVIITFSSGADFWNIGNGDAIVTIEDGDYIILETSSDEEQQTVINVILQKKIDSIFKDIHQKSITITKTSNNNYTVNESQQEVLV